MTTKTQFTPLTYYPNRFGGFDIKPTDTYLNQPIAGAKTEEYARLIAAAGTAATEAAEMGYDGIAAIAALPELLKLLEWWASGKGKPDLNGEQTRAILARARGERKEEV